MVKPPTSEGNKQPPPTPKRRAVRLPHRLTNGSNRCATCRSPGATLCCSDCRSVELGAVHTWYCGTACQIADWPTHKLGCHERRRLFRSVRVLSYCWDLFARATFTKPLVYRHHEDLAEGRIVHVRNDHRSLDQGCWTGRSVFRDFPNCVFPEHPNPDRSVLDEILDHGSSLDSMIYGATLVEAFVSPICRRIREAKFDVRDTAVVYKYTLPGDPPDHRPPNHSNPKHYVFRIDLAYGGSFAIDLTGRQFGFHEMVYRWRDTRHRARNGKVELRPFGYFGRQHCSGMEKEPGYDLGRSVTELRFQLATVLTEAVRIYVRDTFHYSSIRVWFSQPITPEFPEEARQALGAAQSDLATNAHDTMFLKGFGRLYYAWDSLRGGHHVRVTRDKATVGALQSIWFTLDDVDAASGQYEQRILAKEWKNRIGRLKSPEDKRAIEIASQEEKPLATLEQEATVAERKKKEKEKEDKQKKGDKKTGKKGDKKKKPVAYRTVAHRLVQHNSAEHKAVERMMAEHKVEADHHK